MSGCTKTSPPRLCAGFFSFPGTTSPSIDVVTKTLSPHTTGDECARPGIGVFHLMFDASQLTGKPASLETPVPPGPRHPGQFSAADAVEVRRSAPARTIG